MLQAISGRTETSTILLKYPTFDGGFFIIFMGKIFYKFTVAVHCIVVFVLKCWLKRENCQFLLLCMIFKGQNMLRCKHSRPKTFTCVGQSKSILFIQLGMYDFVYILKGRVYFDLQYTPVTLPTLYFPYSLSMSSHKIASKIKRNPRLPPGIRGPNTLWNRT